MNTATAMFEIDTNFLDDLLDALDMAMPDVPEGDASAAAPTFADVMQATFQWNTADADGNLQLLFPHWQVLGSTGPQGLTSTAGIPHHSTPFAGQQQQQQQMLEHRDIPLPVAGTADSICFGPPRGCGVIHSPFAGIDASILQQSAAPVPAPAQHAAPLVAAVSANTPTTAAHSSIPYQQQQQPQQPQLQQQQPTTKRGRPQKVEGAYSKGYSTILKYRQRKKDLVHTMEQEVAEKLAVMQQLQAQQQALLHKQAALESSLGAQQALLAQLEALQLSVGPMHGAGPTVCADAAEVEQVAAGEIAGGQQQQQQQQQQLGAASVLQRYRQYILEAAARLTASSAGGAAAAAAEAAPTGHVHGTADSVAGASADVQQQQQGGSSADADSFPCFPFNLVEALSLWNISQTVGVPDVSADSASSSLHVGNSAAAAAAAEGGSEPCMSIEAGMVNLQSFVHDVVPMSKWVQVAQQLNLQPQQREQLKAAWQLFTAAVDKVNVERQQLVQQLQGKLEEGSTTAVAAAAAAGIQAGTHAQQQPAGLSAAAALIKPSTQGSVGVVSSGGCGCSALSGSDLQGYLDLANAVEWNLVRGRAMVMLFGWAMMCVLGRQQIGRLCVASWPHFPLVRAVAGLLVAGIDQQQQQQQLRRH